MTSLPVQQQHCLSGAWENPSLEHAGFMVALSTFPSLATSVCASTWLKCWRVSKPDWLFILYILISIHGFRDSRTSKCFFLQMSMVYHVCGSQGFQENVRASARNTYIFFLKYEPFFKSLYWICYNIALFHVLVFWPWGMWDLSTQDQKCTPCVAMWIVNQGANWEVSNR